ncbi:MAG: class I SAM-dependent methyltransferase [Bradymonadales bacterium]|nr:class I SAM-dependent methyltransferase [Bradymonadales bacterium]
MNEWWTTFFDEEYLQIWSAWTDEERTRKETDALWEILDLHQGMRILDAPCGYGRVSRELADRGAMVLGVDQSAFLLEEANRRRGAHTEQALRYLCHDLRRPLDEGGFDVALNLFSSIGYGTQEDDLAIMKTLARAVVPGGKVVLDTTHRDAVALMLARGGSMSHRRPDGMLVVEEPHFDPISGRLQNTWYWAGPQGCGQKTASIRLYCITELVALVRAAGLELLAAHAGCSTAPYQADGPTLPRVALVGRRSDT